MTDKIIQHTNLISAEEIKDICRPLEKLNITYFSHVHVDAKGNFSGLSNNPNFSEHYLKNQYYNADIHMAKNNDYGKYILWDEIERCGETEKMDREAEEFGVKHTFTIIENHPDGRDFYHFSTHLDSRIINQVYLANLDSLKMFISYFKDCIKQSKTLSSIYDITFNLDPNAEGFTTIKDENLIVCDEKTFLREIKAKSSAEPTQLILPTAHLSQYKLSKREKECLTYFIRGRSAKEIGAILNLSKRTIEHYLAKTKEKMRVTRKAELIEKVINGLYISEK